MSSILILLIFLLLLIIGLIKKVNCYECFIEGAKEGAKITINMFSYLIVFTLAVSFLKASGLIKFISNIFNTKYVIIGIQMLIRPLSSSSSLSIMLDSYNLYGVDSKVSIFSTLINYISDSTLYIIPFYCGLYKITNYNKVIILGLIVNLFSYFVVIFVTLLFI